MTFFPSVPDDGHLLHVFNHFGKGLDPLLSFHDIVLRGPSDLTVAERELVAAFVSALNDCSFCYNAHKVYATSFGIDHTVFDALIQDVDTAAIDDKLKPMLKYVRKLTTEPVKMIAADAEAVFDAGWSETALHDAILVTSLFNFMNRIIFGHGLDGNEARYANRLQEALNMSQEEREAANQEAIGDKSYAAFGDIVKRGQLPD